MKLTGIAIKYGDSVSTDLIFPGKYTYQMLNEKQMAEHAMEGLDPGFGQRDVNGRIITAGENWGCGSAREQAVKCLKVKGILAIIAKSISRIYYRNCINEGLIPIICPEAAEKINEGDEVAIDTAASIIKVGDRTFEFQHFPEFVEGMLESGGLIPQVKRELERAQH